LVVAAPIRFNRNRGPVDARRGRDPACDARRLRAPGPRGARPRLAHEASRRTL